MNALERLAFDAAMEAWRVSCGRPDMNEQDRVKGALLAYQRQVIAVEVMQESESGRAYRRGPYTTKVDRRCESGVVGAAGECLACNAEQGVACQKPRVPK